MSDITTEATQRAYRDILDRIENLNSYLIILDTPQISSAEAAMRR